MLRISGEIEFITDPVLMNKVMVDRPFLKDLGLSVKSPGIVIFRIRHGEAHFWSMENNLKPKEIIKF
jgi:uncharacterized pyridoxamine 5'-phosphate oxidase family protein